MQVLDGKALSETIKAELKDEVDAIRSAGGKIPHLAAVLVGDNPASHVYVRNKVRSCEQVGFKSSLIRLPEDVSQEDLLAEVAKLNADEDVDGYIVQLPLPKHIDEDTVNLAIDPKKDVDGFTPVNIGLMTLGLPSYLPATPNGIMTMLERYGIQTTGKEVVVLGRSNIVGTPMSILLSRKGEPGNATVTMCHSRTEGMLFHTKRADILIAAIGKPEMVTADMVKEGAVIIDVGINRVEDASRKRGYRLCGDVDYNGLKDKVSAMTPVPGGVGPMTVVSLLMNTLQASKG
ncbi:bifunctional methylenetetrahydrofolate dehydrogenase/methenyltetrahydrofolate cyclohydrolase FolD [Lewinella sp. 4G2]|uniref:bifunctional methylenetetrahydrofolate dehydrogenase/methenyltetrahydrofolate cyclohydrolase FolD n=1 Tax=Lewinella sp. 4G2 TaxID=1803372 RepID=UPI0007B4BDCE|nr:bifunctional methylenetetrahydrofolate dehydrogenase/methenyltetrahydrofolate cyclohydrolase FolD [Lewinella sp. 4G2]OAV45431.1 bifunctional 5,10-methylene-tetrahydrofolate dehydrogenase/5,10-methylene-tetrahydrofolate cyclohydrolase [Lewinella sp. 4G2]